MMVVELLVSCIHKQRKEMGSSIKGNIKCKKEKYERLSSFWLGLSLQLVTTARKEEFG